MDSPHDFLVTFAVVLCAAALTTVLFERLKQPVILGYLLAGLLIGPHLSLVPLSADNQTIQVLAELGVILLLFSIGLQFSIRKLLRVGGSAMVTATLDLSLMIWLGFGAGRLLGFNNQEAIFTGAVVAISSTTIIAKTFEDMRIGRQLRDLVFGVLIVEDLAAVLLLAGLATLGGSGAANPVWETALRLFALLSIWVMAGLLVIPKLMRFVVRLGRAETTLIASLGLCFAFALLALKLGYSVALGAFVAGSLIAESGRSRSVVELVRPVRDTFAAVFFVAVGMLIDPTLVAQEWVAVLVLTLVVMSGKVIAVSSGAFLAGQGTTTSIKAGMSMAQIGEFSFIIATLGLATGVVSESFYPIIVAVSAITTLTTPYFVRTAESVASSFDRRLPKPLQTYASLYGSWVEQLAQAPRGGDPAKRLRKMFFWLLADAVAIFAVIVGAAHNSPVVRQGMTDSFGLSNNATRAIVLVIAATLCAPFLFGIGRMAQGMAQQLAIIALPRAGRLDLADAPRKALVVSLELAIVVLTGLPLLALTQPFLPSSPGLALLLAALALFSILAWRSAKNLQGHVSAGSEVLLAALRTSLPPEQATAEYEAMIMSQATPDRMATATHLLPGMGKPARFTIEEGFWGAGKSLGELELRGRTGATVLAITRDGLGIPAPSATEVLLVADQLVLVGTGTAIKLATKILVDGTES